MRRVAGAVALLAPSALLAAPSPLVTPDKNATATAVVTRPANLRKLQDLDFAFIAVTGAGTATINPNTDVMTPTGGATYVGGLPYAALFEAVSPVKNVVHIRIPNQAITVTRIGGTETMTVDSWTLSGTANRNVVAKEPFTFAVGGTLHINANQAEGTYTGMFTVDIQYN